MGMASGFPAGAKLSARLRKSNQLTQIEAERLVSFTNSSNPLLFSGLFLSVFNNPKLGIVLAAAHYVSNFAVGLLMRFTAITTVPRMINMLLKTPFSKPFSILHETRIQEKDQ